MKYYLRIAASFSDVHFSKRTSGITGESNRIFGREINCNFVLSRITHSVKRCARYATTQGSPASCNSITADPDVHNAAVLACKDIREVLLTYFLLVYFRINDAFSARVTWASTSQMQITPKQHAK